MNAPYGSGGPPTAPAPLPAGATGNPAPTRSNTAVLLATVIAVVVIGGGLSAWLLSTPSYDRSTAKGAAEAFAAAVNSRNVDAAKDLLCNADRYDFDGGQSQYLQAGTVQLTGVDTSGDRGTARFELVTNMGNQEFPVALIRDTDNGQWSVCPSAEQD